MIDEENLKSSDDWCKVELFRWQYGHLPDVDRFVKPLDIPLALEMMAEALKKGIQENNHKIMPTPYNVYLILHFCARMIKANG